MTQNLMYLSNCDRNMVPYVF